MIKKAMLGLDIGSNYIKIIELQHHKTEFVISNVALFEVGDSNISELISSELKSRNFAAAAVSTAVSGKSVAVRYITMPDMNENELKSAIKFEANKYLPFPEDEDIVLDCQKLTSIKSQEGQNNVLLVGVKREYLNYTINLLHELKLQPTVIDVDAFALGNIYEFQQCKIFNNDITDKVVALVDVGASKTVVNIVFGGLSVFTREFYIGGNNFTEAIAKKLLCSNKEAEALKLNKEETAKFKNVLAKPIDDLCQETSMSLDYFTNRYDKEVEEVLLSGGGALLPNFSDEASTTLLKPVKFWNPFDGFSLDQIEPKISENDYSRFTIALGLAVRTK